MVDILETTFLNWKVFCKFALFLNLKYLNNKFPKCSIYNNLNMEQATIWLLGALLLT